MELCDIDESKSLLAFAAYLETELKFVKMLLVGMYGSSNFRTPFTFEFFSFSILFTESFIEYLSPKRFCCLYRHPDTMILFFLSHWMSVEVVTSPLLSLECTVILRKGRWNMLNLFSSEHKCNNLLILFVLIKALSAPDIECF